MLSGRSSLQYNMEIDRKTGKKKYHAPSYQNNNKTGVTILKIINVDSEQGILLEIKRGID